MIDSDVRQQILDDLDRMSPELQKRAQALVHDLAVSSERPPSHSDESRQRFAGRSDERIAREVEAAIQGAESPARGRPASEWVELLRSKPRVLLDEGFGDDLLQILAEESLEDPPSWDS